MSHDPLETLLEDCEKRIAGVRLSIPGLEPPPEPPAPEPPRPDPDGKPELGPVPSLPWKPFAAAFAAAAAAVAAWLGLSTRP